MRNYLALSAAAVLTLTLAACGEGEKKAETPPAATEQPAAPAPAAPAPAATEAPATPMAPDVTKQAEEALKLIKEQAANMTPEQKADFVKLARSNAEAAAKAAGQTDEQVKVVGDQAEASVKEALGL